jgi:hypothetical protein
MGVRRSALFFTASMALAQLWPSTSFAQKVISSRGSSGAQYESAESRRRSAQVTPAPTERWYGWQTLAADGAGIGLLIYSGSAAFEGTLPIVAGTLGVGTLLLGAPAIHAAHGRWGTGALSLGLRIALPLVGVGIAGASSNSCSECGGQLVLGTLVVLSPIWIDAALLAREKVPQKSVQLHLRPSIALNRHATVFGVAGTF